MLKSARTATDLRHVLCIWMRLALGMSVVKIAVALGWSARTVRQVPLSTVHRLLKRHGWHRVALVLIPKDTDPRLQGGQRRPRTGAWSLQRPEAAESPAGSPADTAL